MEGIDPATPHPLPHLKRICFIKNVVDQPNIEIGDYTYCDLPNNARFEHQVLYHYPFVGDKLIIGKFCSLGRGCRFIMNGANHGLGGFSTYPFFLFDGDEIPDVAQLVYRGDTIVGNDVWIGCDATLMPGVSVGDGAVVGAHALVTGDVPPYAVVGGNPARVIRRRFSDEVIAELLEIAWWNWPPSLIGRHRTAIENADLDTLRAQRLAAQPSPA